MMEVEFTKADEVNGHKYKKGDKIKPSPYVYSILKERGSIKDVVAVTPKAKKED